MRFGTWIVKSMCRAGSTMTVSKCKLNLVGVQKDRWEGGGTELAEEYIFFCRKRNDNHEIGIGFFVHKRIISAVKSVGFHWDRMVYMILRGRNVVVL
jgi:hypothetical protein